MRLLEVIAMMETDSRYVGLLMISPAQLVQSQPAMLEQDATGVCCGGRRGDQYWGL
jgi:hypothetical protein